jgi:hypothetical protein
MSDEPATWRTMANVYRVYATTLGREHAANIDRAVLEYQFSDLLGASRLTRELSAAAGELVGLNERCARLADEIADALESEKPRPA